MRDKDSRSALVVVDMQNDVLKDSAGTWFPWVGGVVEQVRAATGWARQAGVPVFWVRVERRPDHADVNKARASRTGQAAGGRRRLVEGEHGSQLVDELASEPTDIDVVKRRISAFHGTSLEIFLRSLGVRELIIGGVHTDLGVESTVRSAVDRDLAVTVLKDCCAAPDPDIHTFTLEKVLPRLANVIDVAELAV